MALVILTVFSLAWAGLANAQSIEKANQLQKAQQQYQQLNKTKEDETKKLQEELDKARKDLETVKLSKAQQKESTQATTPIRLAVSVSDAVSYGQKRNAEVFGDQHWSALYQLWSKESGWRDTALNKSSGACGIPQFISGCVLGDHVSQIEKGLVYIQRRYGNPTLAWNYWLAHRWY